MCPGRIGTSSRSWPCSAASGDGQSSSAPPYSSFQYFAGNPPAVPLAPTSGVDFHAPFGGAKQSSYGPREQGLAARDFYTETRTVTIVP